MDSAQPDSFPGRPLSTAEALKLQQNNELFQHTAPLIGLQSLEDGPGTDSRAVVGIYVGIQGGSADLMGFNPESDNWERVSAIPADDIPNPAAMGPHVDELMEWLGRHHPDESLALYRKVSRHSN